MDREFDFRKISFLVALAYGIVGYSIKGAPGLVLAGVFLLWPLALIWFGDALGRYMGSMRLQHVTSETPGAFVKVFGWILLVLPAILWAVAYFRK